MLIIAATREAATTEKGLPITRAVINKLKDQKLLAPAPAQLIRLVMAGRAAARRLSYRELIRDLKPSSISALEQLLTERVGEKSILGWIAEAPEGMKLKNLKGLIARPEVLRTAAISDEQRKRIHVNRYGIIARDSRVLHAREIQRMASERRHATLVAFVIEKQAAITDLAIDMFCKLIGSARRRAEISQKERRLKAAEVLEVVAQDHIKLGRALLAARDGNTDIESVITASLGWEGLIASMEAAASVASSHHCSELDELIGRQKSLRKLGRLIFRAFSFRAFRPDDSVLLAIGYLQVFYYGRKLPKQIPLDFISHKWRRRVIHGENTDLQAWEVAVFVHLRERLKTGGSRSWRSFEDYLLPHHVFGQMRAESRLGLAIPDNFAEWRAERTFIEPFCILFFQNDSGL